MMGRSHGGEGGQAEGLEAVPKHLAWVSSSYRVAGGVDTTRARAVMDAARFCVPAVAGADWARSSIERTTATHFCTAVHNPSQPVAELLQEARTWRETDET